MIVVAVSDTHADWHTHSKPRFDEVARGMRRSVEVARDRKATLYVHAGDHCDPDSGPIVFKCVELLIEVASDLREAGIPSLWLAGNHDVVEDGTGDTVLSPLRGLSDPGVQVVEGPRDLVFPGGGRRLFVRCLPFTPNSAPYDPREVLRAPLERESHDAAIAVSHLTKVGGAQEGDETSEMPRGRGIEFPFDAVQDSPFSAIIQGHYHTRQVVRRPRCPPMFVVGSMARLTHGEEEHEPGILVLEV